jgi:hypothetical protein
MCFWQATGLFLCVLGFVPIVCAASKESEIQAHIAEMMSDRGIEHEEIQAITKNMNNHEYAKAEQLANQIVERKYGSNPQQESYIKSVALLKRAETKRVLKRSLDDINSDLVASARLGNLKAINLILQSHFDRADSKASAPPETNEIDEILHIGVDLGDAAAMRLVSTGWGADFSEGQRKLFGILEAFQSH